MITTRPVAFVASALAAGVLTASAVGWSLQQVAQVPDAAAASPDHYKVEFENEYVKVVRAHYGAHEKGALHSHPSPGGVVIHLTDERAQRVLPNGTTSIIVFSAGAAHWSPPDVHQEENLSDQPFENIRIDVKAIAAGSTPKLQPLRIPDALNVAAEQYTREFENEYVRITRVRFGPHAKVAMHTHPTPGGVIVAITDQNARLTAPDGTSREVHYKAGDVRWASSTPGADSTVQSAHAEENLSDSPFQLIRIDSKR